MNCKLGQYDGGIFYKAGYSLIERKQLFYLICVFLRLLMAGIVYNFLDKKIIQYAVILFSLASIRGNYSKIDECVWWSREFHLFIGILLLVLAIIGQITDKYNTIEQIPKVLYFDIFVGVIYSLFYFN